MHFSLKSGQISLVVNNSGYGKLYDVSDETEAYNRERLIGLGENYFLKKSHWNNSDVTSFGKLMKPAAYQTLPSGPIDINSAEGKQLRLQIAVRFVFGLSPLEVYKGWNTPNKSKKR